MEIMETGTDQLTVRVPGFKSDVTREADLIEEVLRIYGYNNIEVLPEIRASLSFSSKPDPERIHDMISGYLSAIGFNEIMTNSLSGAAYYEENKDFPPEKSVKILNPLSRDLDTLRQTLLYGGLETIVYNQNRKVQDIKLFEFGSVYTRASGSEEDLLPGYHEERHLGLFMTGRMEKENWNSTDKGVDFFDLKGIIEAIIKNLGLKFDVYPYTSGVISEGLGYSKEDKTVIIFGILKDSLVRSFGCKQQVLYAEWNWDVILSTLPKEEIQIKQLNKFPEVRRDLALLIDQSVTFEQIERIAYDTEKKLIRKIGLFDVYEGQNIQKGKKSYAISFILQDEGKTLTDEEIELTMERLIKVFTTRLNAEIR